MDSFCYLGMKFHRNGNLEPGVKVLSEQALKAANQLLALSKRMSFDIKLNLNCLILLYPLYFCMHQKYGEYTSTNTSIKFILSSARAYLA